MMGVSPNSNRPRREPVLVLGFVCDEWTTHLLPAPPLSKMPLSLASSVDWHDVSGRPKGERECTLSSRVRELICERLTVSSESQAREERVFYFTSSVASI
jgi:hypothetical protein